MNAQTSSATDVDAKSIALFWKWRDAIWLRKKVVVIFCLGKQETIGIRCSANQLYSECLFLESYEIKSPSLDHFVVQNSGDFLCWKYR